MEGIRTARKEKVFFAKSRDGSIAYTSDGSFLYAEKGGTTIRLDLFDKHYYKLRPYNKAVILEVDGLRMQLVRDFDTPLDYAKEVVEGLKIPKDADAEVLDTCMGLGYTAIEAAKRPGVRTVVAFELSQAVITLSKWNPFSEMLWERGGKIIVMEGDASDLIRKTGSSLFSFIIHDPPRFSHAPELYSLAFYQELFRVAKKGGRIFHYVGSVGEKRGRKIENEVEGRLKQAGFRHIRFVKKLQGLFAEKP